MTNFVFDSVPLLRFLRKQPGWEFVRDLLQSAQKTGHRFPMSAVNWGEVYYLLLRSEGRDVAEHVKGRIISSAIEIVLPTISTVETAAEMKSHGGIAYADCFAAALAKERHIPVLTDDKEFQNVVRFGIEIQWLSNIAK